MRTALRFLWYVAATLVLVWLWAHHPTAVPPPPEGFIDWMLVIHGAENGEDLSVVETHYMLAVSFIVVAGGTLLGRYTLRFLKRPHTAQP
ncbi:MAG TPA: hypothetical protein VGP12_03720 [Nitrosospira sp.]|jgi:hypothetical protein|nr:hypothetical protein [Nitrosospira sp.]